MIDTNEMRRNIKNMDQFDAAANLVIALAEIDRLRAKPKPQGKTVRVEVKAYVDGSGSVKIPQYNRMGHSGASVQFCGNDTGGHIVKITAYLPVPEETTVEAEVENA